MSCKERIDYYKSKKDSKYFIKILETNDELKYLKKIRNNNFQSFSTYYELVGLVWDKFVNHVKEGNIRKIEEHLNFSKVVFVQKPLEFTIKKKNEEYNVFVNGEEKNKFWLEEEHEVNKKVYKDTIIIPLYTFGEGLEQLIVNDLYPSKKMEVNGSTVLSEQKNIAELNVDNRTCPSLPDSLYDNRMDWFKFRLLNDTFGSESAKASILYKLFDKEVRFGETKIELIKTHLHEINKEIVHSILKQEERHFYSIEPRALYYIFKREGSANFKNILKQFGEQKGWVNVNIINNRFSIKIDTDSIENPISYYDFHSPENKRGNLVFEDIDAVINARDCYFLNYLNNSKITVNGSVYGDVLCFSNNSELTINGDLRGYPDDWGGMFDLKIADKSKNCTININGKIIKPSKYNQCKYRIIIDSTNNNKTFVKGKKIILKEALPKKY